MSDCKYKYKDKWYSEANIKLIHKYNTNPVFKTETDIGVRNNKGELVEFPSPSYAKTLQEYNDKYPSLKFSNDTETNTINIVGFKTNKKIAEDIDFLPSSEEVKNSDYKELLKTLKNQYFSYEKKLTSVNLSIYNTKETSKLKSLNKTKEVLEKELERLEEELDDALKVTNLEGMRDHAQLHINNVEDLVSDDMSFEDIAEAQRYIVLWQKVGDFSTDTNPFFSDIELESNSLKFGYIHPTTGDKIKGFADYKNEMDELDRKLTKITKQRVTDKVNEVLESDYNIDDVFKAMVDINGLSNQFLDLSRTGDILASAVWKLTKKASFNAEKESVKLFEEIDELIKDIMPVLKQNKKGDDVWNLFMQEDNSGNQTGDFVMPVSQDYWNKSSEVFHSLRETKPGDKNYEEVLNNFLKWQQDNKISFDPRILFPTLEGESYQYTHQTYSAAHKESLITELKKHLGEHQFEYQYKKAEEDLERFKLLYEVKKDELSEEELETWEKQNSPYYAAKSILDGQAIKVGNKFIKPQGQRFLKSVPRAFDSDGVTTGWVDAKYKKIESDPKLLEFYERFTDIMADLAMILPENLKKGMQINTLPTVRKSIFDNIADSGIQGGSAHMFKSIINGIRSTDLSDEIYSRTDAFGEVEKSVQISIADNKTLVSNALRLKIIKYKSENNNARPDYDIIKKMKAEVQDELSKDKSHDLGKIMKAYAAQLYSYKHKSKLEDTLRLASHLMLERDKLETNLMGKVLKDPQTGKPITTSKNLDNVMKVLENHIDNFYGVSTRRVEGAMKNKTLTSEEKKELNTLNEGLQQIINQIEDLKDARNNKEITKAELQKRVQKLYNEQEAIEKQIEKLGGKVTASKLVDRLLNWVQLKTMTWNIPSSFANLGFGDIASLIAAGDGRVFNTGEFIKARRLVMTSHLKLAGVPTKTSKKISKWMKDLDIHKQASQEIKDPTKNIVSNKVKLITPYGPQEASEYMVYAPVMVAMMLHEKVTKGKETSTLWEILDESGSIPEGWTVDSNKKPLDQIFMDNFKTRVDHMIKRTHGNYDSDSPITIKNSSIGKLASQFRSWMFEGIASRFENEKEDHVLGMTTKGRWRSYGELGSVSNLLFTSKQLLRKLSFAGIIWDKSNSTTKFDERFNEVDAANLRSNLTELIVLMNVMALGMMLRALNGDDEDDDMFITNFLVNQMGRLQTDIMLYANPMEFEKLQANIIPASTVINDIGRWFNAVGMAIEGKDALKGGPNSRDSRLLRESLRMVPFGSSYLKTKTQVERTFD
jgi:hypothetical protein